ncbi:uncharacterized protein CCOS01_02034 [Colletotrichum costaricense]|uniref:Uncharacterized protein n=1 Tax=Colletotrichum costaricense TaxID=1209916 RepID=A0AAI9Z8C4_9PEZI|nr:uncharacterized protein CCOS01_02034 [Colletotrichum costaricense]KAK1536714.1 hypothetical protein CCOS01_02034 [Colletotrichum costaricense]
MESGKREVPRAERITVTVPSDPRTEKFNRHTAGSVKQASITHTYTHQGQQHQHQHQQKEHTKRYNSSARRRQPGADITGRDG